MNLNSVKTFYFGIILTILIIQSFACWKFNEIRENKTEITIIKDQLDVIKRILDKK